MAISQSALDSQAWAMKAQGANAMETIASKLGNSLGPPHLSILLQTLITGLHGRTWTGKVPTLYILSFLVCMCDISYMSK